MASACSAVWLSRFHRAGPSTSLDKSHVPIHLLWARYYYRCARVSNRHESPRSRRRRIASMAVTSHEAILVAAMPV